MSASWPLGVPPIQVTIAVATSKDRLGAVRLPARFTVFAGMADVLNGLEACTLAHFVTRNSFANLDNNTSSLMACTFCPQFGHFRKGPVVKHEMDIAEAETGRIEFDQHIVGA